MCSVSASDLALLSRLHATLPDPLEAAARLLANADSSQLTCVLSLVAF